jgi:hypothetical protein
MPHNVLPVAIFALVVAVLLSAALAAVGFIVLPNHRRRIVGLERLRDSRYVVPAQDSTILTVEAPEIPVDMDIVGSWAAEQEARGVAVSDEEMAVQRRMWAEAG